MAKLLSDEEFLGPTPPAAGTKLLSDDEFLGAAPKEQPGVIARAGSAIKSALGIGQPEAPKPTFNDNVLNKPAPAGYKAPPLSDEQLAVWQQQGEVAPWKAEQDAAARRYRAGVGAPDLKAAPQRGAVQRMLDTTIQKPLDQSRVGAIIETAGDAGRGIKRGVDSTAGAAWSGLQAGAEAVGQGDSTLATVAGQAGKAARADAAAVNNPVRPNSLTQQVFESTTGSLPALATFGAGAAGLVAMGAQAAAADYGQSRDAGISHEDATGRAAFMGAAEIIGEKVGMPALGRLFKAAGRNASMGDIGRLLADHALKDQIGEQATLALQSAYEKWGAMGRNPGMTVDDYLADVVNTAQVTLGQAALMGGGAAAHSKLSGATRAGKAQQLADALGADVAGATWAPGSADQAATGLLSPSAPAVQPGSPTARLAGRPVDSFTDAQLQRYADSGKLTGTAKLKVAQEIARRQAMAAAPAVAEPAAAEPVAPADAEQLDGAMQQFAQAAGLNEGAAAPEPAAPGVDPQPPEVPSVPAEQSTARPPLGAMPGGLPNYFSPETVRQSLADSAAPAPAAIEAAQDPQPEPAPQRPPMAAPFANMAAGANATAAAGIAPNFWAGADRTEPTREVSQLGTARAKNSVELATAASQLFRRADEARATGAQVVLPQLGEIQDEKLFASASAVADAIHAATGSRPVLYQDNREGVPDGFAMGGKAYVNATNLDRSLAFTAWHETFHVAEQRAERGDAAAAQFVGTMNQVFDMIDPAFKERYATSYLFRDEATAGTSAQELMADPVKGAQLRSEMVADFLGRRGDDIRFMRHLAQRDPKGFGGFVRTWIDALSNLIRELKARRDYGVKNIDAHIQKLSHAKAVAASALIEWRRSNPQFARDLPAPGQAGMAVKERTGDPVKPHRPSGPRPGDILNPAGKPFKTKDGANVARKRAGAEFGVVKVDDGHVVRRLTDEASNVEVQSAAVQSPVPAQEAPRVEAAAPREAEPAQASGVPAEGGAAAEAGGVSAPEAPASAPAAAAPKPRKARSHPPLARGSAALAEISRSLGGISPDLLADLSDKVRRERTSKLGKKTVFTTWDNPAIPGVGPLFRAGGSADLSEIARVLEEAGFITAGTMEADPLGASQQAQDIVRAELKQGGSTLRVGDADAVEAEAQRRAEAAMDAERDPWEDFMFAPEDLEESGFSEISPELQAEVEAIVSAAEAAGIDTESIREDVARLLGDGASQDEYHTAVKLAIQRAGSPSQDGVAAGPAQPNGSREGDRSGGQVAEPQSTAGSDRADGPDGAVRPEQEGLTLEGQTPADLRAKAEREDAGQRAERAARDAEQERLKREADDRDNKARADQTVDDFRLGQSADEQMSGMGDMFADEQAAAPAPVPQAATKAKIEDLGEKIGGARKDMAPAAAKRSGAKPKDERPAWARRFEVSQIVDIEGVPDAGRWVLHDQKNLNWLKQPKQVGGTFATEEEARAAIPLAAVALKHRVWSNGDKFAIWRQISDRKRVKVVEREFDTRDEAMAYMVTHPVEILEANTTFGEADLPIPANKERVGVQRRQGDVQGSDFMQAFGFRGVEFGNWNNQAERQQIMNEAFDGLLDLAEVMRVPARAISLNGDLALAFGARGHGLSGARAHYEPDRVVMNLTKMNGAGALAHEWFHALDHYLGRQDGKASTTWETKPDGTRVLKTGSTFEQEAVSSGFRHKSGVRPELRAAYEAVMATLSRKAEKYVEDTAKADRFTAEARADVERQLQGIRRDLAEQKDPKYYKTKNKPATTEQLAEFDTIAQRVMDGTALATDLRPVPGSKSRMNGMRWSNDELERFSEIYKAVRGRSGFSADRDGLFDRLRGTMSRYEQRLKMLSDAQAGAEKTKSVPTEFAMDAKSLDQGRGTDYWTTPHEMAARAFQGYVEDKIAEKGGRSPFLNHAPENAAIVTPWGFKRPFPAGEERRAINAALDKLVATIQTREGEGGNVIMFSQKVRDFAEAAFAHGKHERDASVDLSPGAPSPAYTMMGAGRDQPFRLHANYAWHIKNNHPDITAQDLAELPELLKAPKAIINYGGGRISVIIAKRDAGGNPMLVGFEKALSRGRSTQKIVDMHTMFGWEDSMRRIIEAAQMKTASVWMPSEELSRVETFTAQVHPRQLDDRSSSSPLVRPYTSGAAATRVRGLPATTVSVLADAALNKFKADGATPLAKLPREQIKLPAGLDLSGIAFSRKFTQEVPEETRAEAARRQIQDQHIRMRTLRDWAEANGVQMTDASNVYLTEERMHGRQAARIEDFRTLTVKPLIEKIQKSGYTVERVAEVLHAQHAEERNVAIAKINKLMPDGGSGMATADARAILAAAPADLKRLAAEAQAITVRTRDTLLNAGIISVEMAKAWDAAYKHYVPLKGGDEDNAARTGIGKGLSVNGKTKRALGHGEREGGEAILENILRDHERAIMLAEKNRVGQSMLLWLNELDDDRIGTVGKPEKRGVLMPTHQFDVMAGGATIQTFDSEAKARAFIVQQSAARVPGAARMRIVKSIADQNVQYMASPMLAENEAQVYVAGAAVRLQLNDPLLAQSYKRLGATELNLLIETSREINAYLSKAYTGYNPEFIITNLVRDFGSGVFNITGNHGAKVAAETMLAYPKVAASLLRYSITGKSTPLIDAYRAHGGSTGAAYLGDIERVGKDIQNSFDQFQGVMAHAKAGRMSKAAKVAAGKLIGKLLGVIEHANAASENSMRVAVFKVVRANGGSNEEAASAAKNSTLNFNRRGELGQYLGGLYLFFNPSVQGSFQLLDTLTRGKHRGQAMAMTGAIVGMAYVLAMLQFGGDDDDLAEWKKINPSVRDKNLVFKSWQDGTHITMPLPYGAVGFANSVANAIFAAQHGENINELSLSLASGFLMHFSPVGNPLEGADRWRDVDAKSLLQLIPGPPGTGELGRAAIRSLANQNSFGGEIVPDSRFDEGRPDFLKAYRTSKGTLYDWVATNLNSATGGTATQSGLVDVSPETLKFWTTTLTGGAGRFISDLVHLGGLWTRSAMAGDGEETDSLSSEWHERPIARTFIKEERVQDSRRAFWEIASKTSQTLTDLKRAQKAGDAEGVAKIKADEPELVALAGVAESYKKMVSAKRKKIDAINADESTALAYKRAAIKQMELEEARLYDQFLKIAANKGAAADAAEEGDGE